MDIERVRKEESEPEAWGVLITLDHTPFLGTDRLQKTLESSIYNVTQVVPRWHSPVEQRLGPVFQPDFDIHMSLATWLDTYYDARFNYRHPNVAVISTGPLTELAWCFFWEKTEQLKPEEAENNRAMIRSTLEKRGSGNPLPDISLAMLLTEEQVQATAPRGKSIGWLMECPEGTITFFNQCFRRAFEEYKDLLSNLLFIDYALDSEVDGVPEVDLETQFQILADFLSDKLRSHQPIPIKLRER